MPLPEPQFDSRNYREILNEALARIPVHNPEWTNFTDSDPGITLLQLFSFMTESLIYRANLIPERNRLKFLRLLGVPVRAAEAARGFVVFENPRGPLETMTLDSDVELFAGKTPFRAANELQVLPVEAQFYYKGPVPEHKRAEVEKLYRQLYASFKTEENQLDFYETRTFAPPPNGVTLGAIDLAKETIDGSLWLALLARSQDKDNLETVRSEIANKVLTIGILPALAQDGCALFPEGPPAAAGQPSLILEIPKTSDPTARYDRLRASIGDNPLVRPGTIEVTLPGADKLRTWGTPDPLETGVGNYPPNLEEIEDQERLITWIRIRSPEADSNNQTASRQLSARLSWVGINAVQVIQRSHVPAELLLNGTGEPDQSATLIHTPVFPDSIRLTVNGENWKRVDDLTTAPSEVVARSPRLASERVTESQTIQESKVFWVDRESGEIRFGDGIHGMRPPARSAIQVSYDYGGSKQGMVGINAITKGPALPAGLRVFNPVPTWGGSDAEPVATAEKRIPAFLRHRNRLISSEDFKEITWRTPGVELGRVEVLPLFHPGQPSQNSEGTVTVLVIPLTDPAQPGAPRPDRLFLETVCQYLEPRRILTTEVHVHGPNYKPIWVSAGIDVVPGRNEGVVQEEVRRSIEKFLSPLTGGFEEQGWPLEKQVDAAEISAAAARVDGIAKVNQVLIGDESGEKTLPIGMEGLELPRLTAVVVASGDPPTAEEVLGMTEPPPETASVFPVPVVPDICC